MSTRLICGKIKKDPKRDRNSRGLKWPDLKFPLMRGALNVDPGSSPAPCYMIEFVLPSHVAMVDTQPLELLETGIQVGVGPVLGATVFRLLCHVIEAVL
jgi:hypothetical protein